MNRLDGFVEDLCVDITLNVTANLKASTPKDTGFAAANWVPTKGSPDRTRIRRRDRSPESAVRRATVQATKESEVRSFKLRDGKLSVVNRTPYLEQLNEGHSDQAGPGFVQRAVRKAVTTDLRNFRPRRR